MKYNIIVQEIYPFQKLQKPGKLKEAGTCHVTIEFSEFSIDIKNIYYSINKKNMIFVDMPAKHHENVKVPSITFSNLEIRKDIIKKVSEELKSLL